MDVREKLVEVLKKCGVCNIYAVVQLSNALAENGVTVQEWISVKDRLPTEADGTVLVCFADVFPYNCKEPYPDAKHDRRVAVAHHSEFNKKWYRGDGGLLQDGVATHWMTLPKPPKGE